MKFFSLIFKGDVHTATEEKILPQAEYSTLMEAKEIVEKAQEDAKALHKKTQEECKKLRAKAKEEGFEEGLQRFNEMILYFDGELKKLKHETMQSILPLALKAAKKIVGKELESHPETIVDIVLQALAPVSQHHRIRIYVSKSDKELLEKEKSRIREILEQVETLAIQERADVVSGGCIIETEAGIINASIENQWRALEAAFEKYIKR